MPPFKYIPVLALLALLAVPAAPAQAARSDWVGLAREMAAPWPGLQKPDGEFPDYTDDEIPNQYGDGTRYGDAVLGWALIQRGLKEDDQELIDSGVDAVVFATGSHRRRLHVHEQSVFEA